MKWYPYRLKAGHKPTNPAAEYCCCSTDRLPQCRLMLMMTAHTDTGPIILPAFGEGFTNIVFVAVAVPQVLVTAYLIVIDAGSDSRNFSANYCCCSIGAAPYTACYTFGQYY